MDDIFIVVLGIAVFAFIAFVCWIAIKSNIEQKAIAPHRRRCEELQKELDELKTKHKELSAFISNNSVENCKYLNEKLNTAYDDLRSCQFDLDQSHRQNDSLKAEIKRLNSKSDIALPLRDPKELKYIGKLEEQLQAERNISQRAAADKTILEAEIKALISQIQQLKIQIEAKEEHERDLQSTIFTLETGSHPPLSTENRPLLNQSLLNQYISMISDPRMAKALTGISVADIRANVNSGNTAYTTTLTSCTCPDFKNRHSICKHMIALAIHVHAFAPYDDAVNDALFQAIKYYGNAEKIYSKNSKAVSEYKELQKALNEKHQTYPYLADIIANYKLATKDIRIKDPTTKRELTAQYKRTEKENAMLKHQIAIYEYMFPILNEFKDVPPQDLQSAVVEAGTTGFRYQWLSQGDFDALSDADKRQRLIDRYLNDRSKNAWEAGIKYERYIGYLCEQQGYSVKYTGALLKLNDMGRDLIVSKGKNVYVVQCKRYADHKEIHENHLFQLFGSVMHYATEHPDKNVYGVFVTSAAFSAVAAECAKKLDITVYEYLRFEPYPAIKCNVGRSGEKIYHLPFDQQYDTVTVETKKGEMYVSTIKEAEDAGYRHAMRHSFAD